ncbi:hypothetical protein [Microcoleus sp. herbarium2]|uniref:hypothetical protein n=1 Tax=Microcoleus sp. herbarium2 TaxID=3055433 RepID=UPI002FD5DBC1
MNNQNEDSPKFPPARPEITAEIVAIDYLLADLIVKCQDHARELDNLAGVLDNHLGSCEISRDFLLGIQENEPQKLTMTDLPMPQQRMIFGAGLSNAYLLEELGAVTKTDPKLIGERISLRINIAMADVSPQQVTDTLKKYLTQHEEAIRKHKEAVNEYLNNSRVQAPEDNN